MNIKIECECGILHQVHLSDSGLAYMAPCSCKDKCIAELKTALVSICSRCSRLEPVIKALTKGT